MSSGRRCRLLASVVALGLLAGTAHAGGPLGGDGSAISTSRYGVDLTQTPILAGARVTGLGGAYVAIAEGTDANIQTPVAPAVRAGYSVSHFDYEFGLGLTLPATLKSSDFFNTGRKRTELPATQQGFVFFTPAANLVWGDFGVGVTFEFQNYSLSRGGSSVAGSRSDEISALFAVTHLQAAHRFLSGQLVVGAGLRILSMDVTNAAAPPAQQNLFATTGAGLELGVLVMPIDAPFRVGAAFRSSVRTQPDPQSRLAPNSVGDRVIGDPSDPVNSFYLPDRVDMPWDLNLGFAFQFGPRPFNPRWTNPSELENRTTLALRRRMAEREFRRHLLHERLEKQRRPGEALAERSQREDAAEAAIDAELDDEQALDEMHGGRVRTEIRRQLKFEYASLRRQYLLASASLLVIGTVDEAVGIESFLERVVGRSGEKVVYSPRVGVESEFVPNWLKLRAGAYGEPTRFATGKDRLHGTFGFDVRLFPWSVFGLFDDDAIWRASGSIDYSSRYFGWGVSLGLWH